MTNLYKFPVVLFMFLVASCGGDGSEGVAKLPDAPQRPSVVKNNGIILVEWEPVSNAKSYVVYWSNFAGQGTKGNLIKVEGNQFTYESGDGNLPYYYAISAVDDKGIEGLLSEEAFLITYEQSMLGFWGSGSVAIGDTNNDGCVELLGTLNDCAGNLTPVALNPLKALGLEKLVASGRVNRDIRLADFNNDGFADLISNVYSSYSNLDSTTLLFFNNGDGTFREDTAFNSRKYRGFGETVLVTDFDNDGDLDIFIPNYTFYYPEEQNYLLINDGQGGFTEIADQAGVALRGIPSNLRPEGAQAFDFNEDGFIDIFVASHLFINNGNLTFTDVRESVGLPLRFDEGVDFFDWNADGFLDMVHHHDSLGPLLFQNNGEYFTEQKSVFPARYYDSSYGINAEDFDNDGYHDLVLAGGKEPGGQVNKPYTLFAFRNGLFVNHDFLKVEGNVPWCDLPAAADFDRNGVLDMLMRASSYNSTRADDFFYLKSKASSKNYIKIMMLGDKGEQNQQGRTIKIIPLDNSDGKKITYTRIVDGGSGGYLANNEYEITAGAPYAGRYQVEAFYDNIVVSVVVRKGQSVKLYRDGKFTVTD